MQLHLKQQNRISIDRAQKSKVFGELEVNNNEAKGPYDWLLPD